MKTIKDIVPAYIVSIATIASMRACIGWNVLYSLYSLYSHLSVRYKKGRAASRMILEAALPERRRRPTLPHCGAVPSARPGLTSLFGMGRGGTPGPKPPDYALGLLTCGNRRGKERCVLPSPRGKTMHAPGLAKLTGY